MPMHHAAAVSIGQALVFERLLSLPGLPPKWRERHFSHCTLSTRLFWKKRSLFDGQRVVTHLFV